MTHKERVQCAVARCASDRLPTQITFTADMADRVVGHLGASVLEVLNVVWAQAMQIEERAVR